MKSIALVSAAAMPTDFIKANVVVDIRDLSIVDGVSKIFFVTLFGVTAL